MLIAPCQELLKSQANSLDLGTKVTIFGRSRNPVPPCLPFTTLFDLFVLSRSIALMEIQASSEMDPKSKPSVSQQSGANYTGGRARSALAGTNWGKLGGVPFTERFVEGNSRRDLKYSSREVLLRPTLATR